MARILISGWYGFGNLGDEAILSAIAASIRGERGDAEIRALSFDPGFTARFNGLSASPQLPCGVRGWLRALFVGQLAQTLGALRGCDLLLLGGGGFLSDWQPEAPWIWLRQALLARLLGKKVMLYGIGAGPFSRPFGMWLTRSVINNFVSRVTVRDEKSRQWLLSAGAREDLLRVTADPAVSYPVAPRPCPAGTGRVVGICVAPVFHSETHWPGKRYKYQRYLEAMASVVGQLLAEGFEVVFIPMQEGGDVSFAEEIAAGQGGGVTIAQLPGAIDEGVAMLSRVDILITMRFHAALLGALQGVPVAGIIYHHKVAEFLDSIGMREFAEELGDGSNWREADIDSRALVHKVKEMAARHPELSRRMAAGMARLQERQRGNLRALAEVLGEGA